VLTTLARDHCAPPQAMKEGDHRRLGGIGGPAAPAEIKAMLARDFADELAAKDALVKEAERLDADAAPLTGPGASHAPTPVANIRELAADDGDFLDRTPVAKGGRVAASPGPSASVFITPPPSSLATAPAGIAMVDLADPSTDLLRSPASRGAADSGDRRRAGDRRRRTPWAGPGAVPGPRRSRPARSTPASIRDADLADAGSTPIDPRDIAALARYGFSRRFRQEAVTHTITSASGRPRCYLLEPAPPDQAV
jgi:hypothetical protein